MRVRALTMLLVAAWALAAHAQSPCDSLALPWAEDFDSQSPGRAPVCWAASRNYDLGPAPQVDTSQAFSGPCSLMLYSGSLAGSHYSLAIAPPLQAASLDGLYLRLRFRAPSTATRLEVGFCQDTGRYSHRFTPIDTLHADRAAQWQEMVVDLGRHTGPGRRLAFRMQRSLQAAASECHVDNLRIGSCGTTQPVASHLTAHSLTLSWDAYGAEPIALSYGNITVADAQSPVTLYGLQPATPYTFTLACDGSTPQQTTATTLAGPSMVPAWHSAFAPSGLALTPADSLPYVLPLQESADLRQLHLALLLRGRGSLVVGVMDYPLEASSFTPVDTFPATPSWQRHLSTLAPYAGSGAYLALRAIGDTLHVDHLRVARCLVDSVRLYNLTDEGATLDWQHLTDSVGVTLEYGPPGFAPGSGTALSPASKPFTLTGLTSSSPYDLLLYPSCGDQPCAYDRLSFTTLAHASTLPYCASFDASGLPLGWVCPLGTAAASTNAYEGSHSLQLVAATVTLPLFVTPSADTLLLEFQGAGSGTLQVGTMDTPYGTFTPADSVTGSSWNRHYVRLAVPEGHLPALRCAGTWRIDALTLHRHAATSASVRSIGQTSARLAWTMIGPDSAHIEYRAVASAVADFTPGTGTPLRALDSITLTGLAPASHYAVHIGSLSDSGTTCFPLTLHLRTAAAPVAAPVCEHFNSLPNNGFPSTWRRASTLGDYPLASTQRSHSAQRSLYFRANANGRTAILLPDLVSPSEHLTLSFWAIATQMPRGSQLVVGRMADIADWSSFVPTDTLSPGTAQWTHHSVSLGTSHAGVALMLIGGNGEARLFVDDLCVEPCTLEGFRATHTDSVSTTLDWYASGADSVEVTVQGSDFDSTFVVAAPPLTVGGLTPDRTYTVAARVRCDCGGYGAAHKLGYGSTGSVPSDQTASLYVNTPPPYFTPPYCLDFEGFPVGSVPYQWLHSGGSVATTDALHHDGYRSLALKPNTLVALPPTEAPGSLTATLYAFSSNEAALREGALLLGTMYDRNDASSFVPTDTLRLSRLREWQRLVGSLASAPDTHAFVALKLTADTCTLYVDNLTLAPCGIAQASVSADGTVQWQPLGTPSEVAIEYGPRGFTRGSGVLDTVSLPAYSLSNLSQGTNYDIYLTPLCSGTPLCLPVSLTLSSPTAPPYCEYFETPTGTGLPEDWSVGRTLANSPSAVAAATKALALKGTLTENLRSMAVLPAIASDGDSLWLHLSLRTHTPGTARLLAGLVDGSADPNTFTPLDTLGTNAADVWQRCSCRVLIPAGKRLALCAYGASQTVELWVDSLAVTRTTSPTLAATSSRTLDIHTASPTAHLEYGTENTAYGSGSHLFLSSSHYTLDSLQPGQRYWFMAYEDSTTPACLPPKVVQMPNEEQLPYCHPAGTLGQLQLPELAVDSVSRLHLYATLGGNGQVEVGVMDRSEGWETLVPVDTLVVADLGPHHVALAPYSGNGRFVGLRKLGGAVTMDRLVVTDCPWVTATLRDDNSVLLLGNGLAEYGLSGFTPGEGTMVTVDDSLILAGLPDTTAFDFYPYCGLAPAPCQEPDRWVTTTTLELPYCASFDSLLPAGWTAVDDGAGTINISDNCLDIHTQPGHDAGVLLPALPGGGITALAEVFLSSVDVALAIDHDTLHLPAGVWHTLQLSLARNGRPRMAAVGDGTVRLRRLELTSCPLPKTVSIRKEGGGQIALDWNPAETNGHFYIGCRLQGGSSDSTIQASVPPLMLSLLADTAYDLFLKCDSLEEPCRPPLQFRTLPLPHSLPYCADTVLLNPDRLPYGWNRTEDASGTAYLTLPQFSTENLRQLNILLRAETQHASQRLTLGAMSDATDPYSFDSLAAITQDSPRLITLGNYYGNGRFLAIRAEGTGWVRLTELSVATCAAYDVRLSNTETDRATFTWEQQGMPTVSVEYGPTGFTPGNGTTLTATEPPLNISGLDPLTDYTFLVGRQCADIPCRPTLTDTFHTFTPKGGSGCIDYTDLHAAYVTCKYGTYENPSLYTGAVDLGYRSADSRHTVHYDTTERDSRTGNLLRTVPSGDNASVRLGNWTAGGSGNAQGESITYGLTVDSTQFDLLILKYAAVLQDPEHSASLQPRFRLEILNQNDALVDSCGMAFFIANPNLNWNQADDEVLWKDWTTVGMDLTAYHGQTIFIRLTTNDCGEGSHFGYAYFTLGCASKRMRTEGCSNVPSNRFTAPAGFRYRWYTNHDASTLSDSASIWVRSDNSLTYYCNLSFVDNPECNFTMSAFAGARYPLSLFDTALSVADCQFDLTLTNRSTISGDGLTPIGTGESCESTLWLLPGGGTSAASAVTLHLTDTGTYSVSLISGIADDQCIDTLRKDIHIGYPHPPASLNGPTRRCDNASPDILRVTDAASYRWADGTTGPLAAAPPADTTYVCHTVDRNGCPDTLRHSLRVFSSYSITDPDSICNSQSTYRWADTTVAVDQSAGVMVRLRRLRTTEGCDSVHTLRLQLMPSYHIDHHDTLCHDSQQPFFDTLLTTTGTYLHTDSTAFGCDSMVTMHLLIVPRAYADDRHEVCDSMTWIDRRTYRADTAGVRDTLHTARGCDSVVTLYLTVHRSTYEMAVDTFCQGSTYRFRSHLIHDGGWYADTLATRHGCDSVLAISLTRLDMPRVELASEHDCDSLYHHIEATSSVPYLLWTSYPPDSTLDGQETLGLVHVHPTVATTYTLYTDYAADPHCPATATLTLAPVRRPEAQMKVNPSVLVYPSLGFDAYDVGTGHSSRQWYLDGVLQGETSGHLRASADPASDSAEVALVVGNGLCADTALMLLPVLRRAIAAPNAFTPDADNNNTFHIANEGLTSTELHIYNRQGALVFRSDDPAWDGRNRNGEPCPTGSYVWHLRYTTVASPTSHETATGTVLLIR